MGSSGLHPTAAHGFEISADAYERGRPGYPSEAVDWLSTALGLRSGTTVVDLAAGTGKLTRELIGAPAFVVAIEPLRAMRAELVRVRPGIPVVGAVAERLPLAVASIDAVVVANAWHWFDSQSALAEVHRVLRARGRLAVVYNRRDERVRWVSRLGEIIDDHRGETPQYRSGRWHDVFEKTALFEPLERNDFAWDQPLTPALLRDRVASISFIARLDPPDRDDVMRAVDELVVEEFGSPTEFTMPHTTEIYVTTARAGLE